MDLRSDLKEVNDECMISIPKKVYVCCVVLNNKSTI